MECVVFELKIDKSKLSQAKENSLNQAFCEAKWIYNAAIASEDLFKFDVKKSVEVNIFNPLTQLCDITETRPLTLGLATATR